MSGPDPALRTGQLLGHYTVLGPIGKGGMGEVYRARDARLDRVVALKLLPLQVVHDRERMARFQKEARTLAALNHPSIVTIHAVEEVDAWHFLVMEFVEGKTLRELVQADPMPLAQFFDIALPLTDALAAAHEGGIIHRDLKPENLMFTPAGRLKILDFGLARSEAREGESGHPSDDATQALTRQGFILGTVPYLSPEQAQGKAVDHRSDIFSLGIVLYEMLTGHRPFQGESSVDVISAILRDAPEPLEQHRIDLPPELGRILRRCLEKAPADRFPSVLEIHHQLRALREEMEARRILSASQNSGALPSARILPRLLPLLSIFRRKAALHALLGAVFAVNLVETLSETWLREHLGLGVALGDRLAQAAHAIEGGLNFEFHDQSGALAVYGFSIAYFFLFPLLALWTAGTLARREDASYRVLVYAVGLTYAISLPFFLFFPVPERWFYPESGAILLSDLWTSRLIEAFRPMSGIDNCFPSSHTSLTVVLVLAAYRYGLGRRHVLAALGALIVLSAFALGIHWLTDLAAGALTGLLAFLLALAAERRTPRIPSHARTTLHREATPSGT